MRMLTDNLLKLKFESIATEFPPSSFSSRSPIFEEQYGMFDCNKRQQNTLLRQFTKRIFPYFNFYNSLL